MDRWYNYPQQLSQYQPLYPNAVQLAQEQHDYYEQHCGGKPWNDGKPWN
jgi:hypothetical protein